MLRAIYGDIPKSVLTTADRNTLNLKERKHGAPRPAIGTAPILSVKALGNLQIQIDCRVEGDENRPSIHPDADGVELRAYIGDTPPPNYEGANNISFKSKARFTEILDDPTFMGKWACVFARWVNTSDNTKSGPWSPMVSVIIN